jgi:GNAT superfamily N-acetyltransferase
MHLKTEHVSDTYEELDALVREYHACTVAPQGLPPLDINWPVFCAMQDAGMLELYTAREKDELLGCLIYHVYPHLHHRNHLTAACDRLAVRPKHRGQGIGRSLMEYAEPRLRAAGVHSITHLYRTCYNTKPLFPKLGYKLIEYGYMKELN